MILAILSVLSIAAATLLSDSGCHCALLKTINATPGAGASPAGCSVKPDWNGTQTRWCLTDQTPGPGPCGTTIASFGVVDTCALAGFPTVYITPSGTLYTGQNVTVTWSTTNILPDELLKLSYNGRTLVPNVSSAASSTVARLSTTGTNLTVVVNTLSSPAVSANSSESLTVLQSALTAATLTYNGSSIAGTTQLVDDRAITIAWTGVGDAASGNTTVTVKSNGGFGGTKFVGTPVWTLANSTLYTLPRSFVPSGGGGGGGGTTYIAAISLLSPAGITYTFNSPSFSLSSAPSQTPTPSPSRTPLTPSLTPTQTPSPTQTPTPSLSFGATASNTASVTPTLSKSASTTPTLSVTSSITPTPTLTPSPIMSGTPSQTPAASVDYIGIAAAASAEAAAKSGALIGGVIGGVVAAVILGVGSYRVYERYQYRQRRLRSMQATTRRLAQSRAIEESAAVVGMNPAVYEFTRPRSLRTQTQLQRQQDRARR